MRRRGSLALAVLVVATGAALPLGSVSHAAIQLPLLVVALAAFAVVVVTQRRAPFLGRGLVVGLSGALVLGAALTPPASSKDVWAHVMYGRIVAVHHASPYVHPPADYPSDPSLARIAPAWRHTRSVYGPAFTGISAVGAMVAGDSPVAQRLFFQLLAALAIMAALALLWRRGADAGALAFVGLNPAVLLIVAGGHNDLLVGAVLLGAVVMALERRPALAGVLLAVAVLVKVAAVLPVVAVVAWIAVRQGWRPGARAALVAAGTTLVGYALAGGTAVLGPLHDAANYRSKASLWTFPVSWTERQLFGVHGAGVGPLSAAAVAVVVVVAAVVVASRLGDVDPAVAAGAAAMIYLLGAAYVLPWYAGWTIPVLALAWRSRLALLAAAQAAVYAVIYVDRPGDHSAVLHHLVGTVATHVVPVAEAAALVALVVVSARRLRPALGAARRDRCVEALA